MFLKSNESLLNDTRFLVTSPGAETEMWVDQGVPRSESEPKLSSSSKLSQSASLWGSFTGSFFENPKLLESKCKIFFIFIILLASFIREILVSRPIIIYIQGDR